MQYPERFVLPGSERDLPDGHSRSGGANPDEPATVTVYLRPREQLDDTVRVSREEYAARCGATSEDIDAVRAFANEYHLTAEAIDAARRSVTLSGRLGDLETAFGTTLGIHTDRTGRQYRGRTGPLLLPLPLEGVVTGVFGLDQRPQATPHLRQAAAPQVQYTPVEVATAYAFPTEVKATGECIGIVELGGGYRTADLDTYFAGLGMASPTVAEVDVDGGSNAPGTADGPDGEVMLDIEVAGAVAPGASVAVYFAPNTDQGFIDAVTTAVHDTAHHPSVVSISWGGPESTWTSQAMTEMEAAFSAAASLGVTITAAAGDSGSTDGIADGLQHADFPASAPHALACGGTSLTGGSEVVWNSLASGGGATGGGISDQFELPAYQSAAAVPPSANPGGHVGRGVPDVAGNADPATGYSIRVDGQNVVVGGTSAVAPLWAGLVACLNADLGTPLGFLEPRLYGPSTAATFRDITSGDNGAYRAGPGWDPCTGLGSPNGTALLAALRAALAGRSPAGITPAGGA
jgi:kumamolisin